MEIPPQSKHNAGMQKPPPPGTFSAWGDNDLKETHLIGVMPNVPDANTVTGNCHDIRPPADIPDIPDIPTEIPTAMDNSGPRRHEDQKQSIESKGSSEDKPKQNKPISPGKISGLFEFSNVDAIKQKVRAEKLGNQKESYDVKSCYHKTGFFQWLATHPYFENTTLGIIVVNALWISIDTDLNKADTINEAKKPFVVADCLFFGYFSLELFVRFMAFKRKCDCCKDPWFVFDTSLVSLYAFDPFAIGIIAKAQGGGGLNLPTSLLRLFRLARLSRLVRMLRSLPELMVMIKGMITATSTVGYTLVLLMLITYVFGIAFVNLSGKDLEITEKYFSTVPETMHNLIIYGTFLDALSDFILDVKAESPACFILVWIYIAIASLTVLNMLIGVLCEVISAVAAEEQEAMMVDKVFEKFDKICKELDENGDGTLDWDEFSKILDDAEALKALESVGVDAEGLVDAAEEFFIIDGEMVSVQFEDFMHMVLDMRGSKQVSVADLMSLSKRMSSKFLKMENTVKALKDDMQTSNGQILAEIAKLHQKLDDRLSNSR